MDIENFLIDIFGENSEEVSVLLECSRILNYSSPTTSSEAKNRMFILDNIRPKLANIYFMLNRTISYNQQTFQKEYDTAYVRFVKLGRPSKDAIESEIRLTFPEYTSTKFRNDSLNHVKDLIDSYLRCIDESKRTAVEILRNSNRLD